MTSVAADWPFLPVSDAAGDDVGWVLINAPLVEERSRRQLAALRREGYRFAGMSSHLSFPLSAEGNLSDERSLCEAWCHCFRHPDRYLGPTLPRALVALSDFTDPAGITPATCAYPEASDGARDGVFDFVYVGGETPWKQRVKRWDLAVRVIRRLTGAGGLSGLVLQTDGADALADVPGATVTPKLPRWEFLSLMSRCRFLLVASGEDPSPRILAEALCLDIPVLVQRDILGGWHYVTSASGAFFDDENDVVAAAQRCVTPGLTPRRMFMAQHGPVPAGRRLLALLGEVDPSITETSHLTVDFGISEPLAPPIATAAPVQNPWHRQSGKAGAGPRDRTETAMGRGSPNGSGGKTRS